MEDKTSTSILGAASQTAEPTDSASAGSKIDHSTSTSTTAKLARDSSSSNTKKLHTRQATSAANSPNPSRDSSPVRPPLKSITSARTATGPSRSRKNSTDTSPSRSVGTITNPPSAAATQRALSAAPTPALHPLSSDLSIKAPAPQKPSQLSEPKETPRWPISPRLRSPPPVNKPSLLSPRKAENEVSALNVQRLQSEQPEAVDTDLDDSLSLPSGMRTPGRGPSGASTLETVQEISQPNTPGGSMALDGILEQSENTLSRSSTAETETALEHALRTSKTKANNESGSDSGGKGEMKMRSTSAAPNASLRLAPTKSYAANSSTVRGKPSGDGSKNMTVETETVSSIPQVAVGGPVGGSNGSIRTKPSSETIRPKKEKKKTTRKNNSVASGTASSKADIFEAKVASAVDEADSSDSEETFVYESNPPDVNDRSRRFHSRTPSATSMASQADQRNGTRALIDGAHSVAMKKSMKFANTFSSNGPEGPAGEDDGKGTTRSNMGTGRGTAPHHVGRWGRGNGNGHPSLFDNESPFPNASKSKFGGNTPRHLSRPTSPRISHTKLAGNGKKQSPITSGYDLDDGADDERAPLISTVRSGRSGRPRRPPSSLRQLEHQALRQDRTFIARFAGCLALSVMIIFVIAGAVGIMFTTTQPLTEVEIVALKDVLASEQDIIFDIQVRAKNSNIMAVSIDTADIIVFAKSEYAGTDSEWWAHPPEQNLRRWGLWEPHGDDRHKDPPDDKDPTTNPNLEIGHIFELYSPLTFEGSLFHTSKTISVGQIRVIHPGNETTPAGSERWGRVLQHEFDLIIRGKLKYNLPLNQKVPDIRVEGRVAVKPNAADESPSPGS